MRKLPFILTSLLLTICMVAAEESAQDLNKAIYQHFAAKDYPAALTACRELIKLEPDSNEAHYNLACALARNDDKDGALASLAKSVELGFSDADHIGEDDDLASLHSDARFDAAVKKAREKEKGGDYEKGAEIPGVKTVENYPDGGLRYRVRMSENAEEKPNRLIVWLHPSGGSMNRQIESMAPLFVKHGYALLVVTKKQWMGWMGPESEKLINKTLPNAAKIKGIDASKPILMGFSAGGQAALELYFDKPAIFGGLVLDAAYPLDMEKRQQGKNEIHALPKDEAVQKVPMFVLVGDKDGGSQVWKNAEPAWREAGVPLTIRYVPNGVHQWLFGKSQVADLEEWLTQIADGKLPADPAPKKTD